MRERGSVQPAAINSAAASLVHLVAEKNANLSRMETKSQIRQISLLKLKKKDFPTGLHPALVFSC